jgi:RNA polymerase sigma factor for flagellar operon FliA
MNVDWELAKRDTEHRNDVLLSYMPLVRFVAGRTASNVSLSPGVSHEDLVSYGIFGLIEAIERFDPDKGVSFQTYAYMRIRGSIIDELRLMDWAPRSLRAESRDLAAATESLQVEFGRAPTDSEIANLIGWPKSKVSQVRDNVRNSHVGSVQQAQELGHDAVDHSSYDEGLIAVETTRLIDTMASCIDKLPQEERAVLYLHYWEGVPMKHIPQYMGISQQAAAKIYNRALMELRLLMADVY